MIKNKYWGPIQQNLDYVASLVQNGDNVLEIGPGDIPFSKATEFCGWVDEEKARLGKYKNADICSEILPYKNKEFDFVYARHVIEDLWNPIHAIKEISRIAKRGYLETPSPLCEMSKGVDGGDPPYRGYSHHRYFVWNDSNVLHLLPKFPIVEHMKVSNESVMEQGLENPFSWNTYFYFEGDIQYKFYQMGYEQDFVMYDNSYFTIINNAIHAGMQTSKQQLERVRTFYEHSQRNTTKG